MSRRVLLAALAALPLMAAGRRETQLSDPKPSIDAPRRLVVSISERDPDRANAVFSNIINIQGFYGPDMVEIVVVAYGPGVRHLLKEDSQVAERVASLQAYGIEFLACGATLDTLGLGPEAALPDIAVVQNGLPEIVERQVRGWVHIRP
jgi:intracellular sulfur oxidation DsrE/DsrF family protein